MNEIKDIGYIGSVNVRLDITDPARPALILTDNAQAEHLAGLLSPDPVIIDWISETDDHTVIRLPITDAVDRVIVDMIEILASARYSVPGLVQLKMLDAQGTSNAAR